MLNEVASAQKVYNVAPPFLRVGFAEVGNGLVGGAADELTLVQTGLGMTVGQSGGNLNIATGVTPNAETIVRSKGAFTGPLLTRVKTILSQRIVNQLFRYELADLIGENLSFVVNSATSVTVTFIGSNPFTEANIGQSVRLGAVVGVDGVSGRYPIASVSGKDVEFTVVGWPASGSGTLTLYGWNYIAVEYSGITATTASFDTQRRGWSAGAGSVTTNTTATGHVTQLVHDSNTTGLADSLVASTTVFQWTQRGSRIENIPDPEVPLYLFITAQNGAVAPASTTTWTIGFLQIENQSNAKIRIASADPATSHALPVQMQGGTLAVSSVTGGSIAEDAVATLNPVVVGGVVRTANAPTTLIAGDSSRLTLSSGAQLIVKPYAPAQVEWAASLSLTSTTPAPLAAAAAAGIRNHITSFWAINTSATIVELILLDGVTERARYPLPPNVPIPVQFPTGILTTAATALNANLSAAATAVRIVATGYTSA